MQAHHHAIVDNCRASFIVDRYVSPGLVSNKLRETMVPSKGSAQLLENLNDVGRRMTMEYFWNILHQNSLKCAKIDYKK